MPGKDGVIPPAASSPDAQGSLDLYEVRKKIYPRAVIGVFARWRWAMVFVTQLVYYGTPWLTWNGRQAVLFDLAARKFYIFGLVLWPQDFVYLTALLIISAFSLFLFTAIAGRLWCGYTCPQTVYSEIFLWIERKVEGERAARLLLDRGPLTARKFLVKTAKHGIWIAFAAWTGFTFVGYFVPIKTLGVEVVTFSLGGWEIFWIVFYSFTTYGNAGWMREQVCIYMCPYARFQGVMFDRDTLLITYDGARGEPRGPRSIKVDRKTQGLGDCVGCNICVQVCPTGIDIREGQQYECIGCAACIDGCDQVMDRMGYARGLIRYSTLNAVERGYGRREMIARAFRPRVLVYMAILLSVVTAASVTLFLRVPFKVDVIRDRAALAREVQGGLIENVYRLQVINTNEVARRFTVSASGIDGLRVDRGRQPLEIGPATTKTVAVRLSADPGAAGKGMHRIEFRVVASDASGNPRPDIFSIRERSVFYVP